MSILEYHQEVLVKTMSNQPQPEINRQPDPPREELTMPSSTTTPTSLPAPHRVIKLEGLHVITHMEGVDRLNVKTPLLSPEMFKDLSFAEEDWKEVVNDKWKNKRTMGGRSWRAAGKKVTEAQRPRVFEFEPFPSSIPNEVGSINTFLHDELRLLCLVLEREQKIGWKQNFYILPYRNVPAFMGLMEAVNKRIADVNRKIEEFTQSSDYQDIKNVLAKYNLSKLLEKRWNLSNIWFEASELELEPTMLRQTLDKVGQQMIAQFDDNQRIEFQRRMSEFQRQVQEAQHERVDLVMADFNKKLSSIVQKIASTGRKRSVQSIKENLEYARNIAASMGLEAVATSIIDPLTIVVDHPERAIELFGVESRGLTREIDSRLRGLMEGL